MKIKVTRGLNVMPGWYQIYEFLNAYAVDQRDVVFRTSNRVFRDATQTILMALCLESNVFINTSSPCFRYSDIVFNT